MAEISKKKENKFSWKPGDISFEEDVSIPDNLQSIVNDAPLGDQEKAKYLQSLLDDEIISIDDVTFLIDSGALGSLV